jgi:hypothetical protein
VRGVGQSTKPCKRYECTHASTDLSKIYKVGVLLMSECRAKPRKRLGSVKKSIIQNQLIRCGILREEAVFVAR